MRRLRARWLPLAAFLASFAGALGASSEMDGTLQISPASERGQERERVAAPRLGMTVHSRVTGTAVRTRVVQIFFNPTDDWVDGVYLFPLPEDAAVDHLRLVVDGQVIEGEIAPREEAAELYDRAAESGRAAAVVHQYRPNLFTSSIANIPPSGSLEIEIEFRHQVYFEAGRFVLRMPLVAAERFQPRGADRVPTSPRAAAGDEVNPTGVQVDIVAGFPLAEIVSPSHEIAVQRSGAPNASIRLADHVTPANRDLVVEWAPVASRDPEAFAYVEEVGGETYGLLMARLPLEGIGHSEPRELIFVLDVSGSMKGVSLQQAKRALARAIDELDDSTLFNIIVFDDDAARFFDRSRLATRGHRAEAIARVEALESGGGTRILTALELALADEPEGGRLRQVVLITDGAVSNERRLGDFLEKNLGRGRLFAVGIGASPNSYLIRTVSRAGRGTSVTVDDIADVERKIGDLMRKLATPPLTDLAIDWSTDETLPNPLSDLFPGNLLEASARLNRLPGTVRLTGYRQGKAWERVVDLSVADTGQEVSRTWAHQRIESLDRELRQGVRGREQLVSEIQQIAVEHHLVTGHTSLVAIDHRVRAPQSSARRVGQVPLNTPPDGFTGGDIEETITVTSESPLLDERRLYSGATGTLVSRLELDQIPTARDPGAQLAVEADSFSSPVSGRGSGSASAAAGPRAASVAPGVRIQLDGFDVAAADGSWPSPLLGNSMALTEVEIQRHDTAVSQLGPEAQVELITKRGTNQLRGSAAGYGTIRHGAASSRSSTGTGGPSHATPRRSSSRVVAAEVGGALSRDRAWLWGTGSHEDGLEAPVGGGETTREASVAGTKFQLQAAASNAAVASWFATRDEATGLGKSRRRDASATWDGLVDWSLARVSDSHVVSSNHFLTLDLIDRSSGTLRTPLGTDRPLTSSADGTTAGHESRLLESLDAEEIHLGGSYFFHIGGSLHEMRPGTTLRVVDRTHARRLSADGLVLQAGSNYGLAADRAIAELWQDGLIGARQRRESLWIDDTVGSGRLTAYVGLRLDRERWNTSGPGAAGQPGDFVDWQEVAPRASASLAVSDSTVVRLSAGRYFSALPSRDLMSRLPGAPSVSAFLFDDNDGDLTLDGEEEPSLAFWYSRGFDPLDPSRATAHRISPDLEPERTDRAVVTLEHSPFGHLLFTLELGYQRRDRILEARRLVRDLDGDPDGGLVREAEADDYVLLESVTGTLPDGTPYTAPVFDLAGHLSNAGGGLLINGDREQQGLLFGLGWQRRLEAGWTTRGRIDYADRTWRGGELFRRFDDPTNLGGSGDNPGQQVVSTQSDTSGTSAFPQSRWSLSSHTLVELPRRLKLGVNVLAREGGVLPYFRSVYRPNAGPARVELTDRVDSYRLPDLVAVDLLLARETEFDRLRSTLFVEVLDLFDRTTVSARALDLALGSANLVDDTQPASSIRLGVSFQWK